MAHVNSTIRAPGAAPQTVRARAGVFLQPAMRAYMIGYLLDALPILFKQLLRFVLVTMRNIRKVQKRIKMERLAAAEGSDVEKQVASSAYGDANGPGPKFNIDVTSTPTTMYTDGVMPALRQVPLLLNAMLKALVVALGPRGVGAACALTIASTAVLDIAFIDALKRAGSYAGNDVKVPGRAAAFSTFASAALASSTALYMLQRAEVGADHDAIRTNLTIGNPFRRKNVTGDAGTGRGVPTPLAPGGHFLARLTTLSIPTTPRNERGSRSPAEKTASVPEPSKQEEASKAPGGEEIGTASPTIDLSLFALVRAMDTLARALPLVFAVRRVPRAAGSQSTAIGPAGGPKIDTSRNQLTRARSIAHGGFIIRIAQSMATTLQDQAHGLAFVFACAIIMFNWFYHPERLPPTYVRWISNLASMDSRALEALRCLRYQKPYRFQYGDRGMDAKGINVLGSLSESLGHSYSWGDVSRLPISRDDARQQKRQGSKEAMAAAKAAGKPTPEPYILEGAVGPRGRGEMGGVPCEVIHCGVGGGNCYKNALYRFLRAWRMCLGIYVPVHLLPRLIFGPGQFKRQPLEAITKVLVGSARSATFLSTFIASIWFMVCLGRSILLPRLFPSVTHRFWDAGLGPIMGSWTCGWSVFIEEPRKRAEMALYVAPRALFALAEMGRPGWLSRGKKSALQAERLLFGMSVGIVVAAARHRPDLLRGITALMAWVVAPAKAAGKSNFVKTKAPRD